MYTLTLDTSERAYLLSILEHMIAGSTAREIAARLRSAEDAFGVVMWTDADIASILHDQGLLDSSENIQAVRSSYGVRHIDEGMIQEGWRVLEEVVSEISPSKPTT